MVTDSIIAVVKKQLGFILYFRNEYREQQIKLRLCDKFKCTIDSSARIHAENIDDLMIGHGVYIGAFTIIRVGGGKERNSSLEIGESTYIGEQNNIRAGGGVIRIGRDCLISQQVSIIASNHGTRKNAHIADQPWSTKKNIIIGDDVWIGCGVQIMPGVEIGSGAIVGAGSLVNKGIPPNAVVGGVPAEILKFRE